MPRFPRLLAAALILWSAQAIAADLPYLFERLKSPPYRAAFAALFRGESGIAPWLDAYMRDRNGVDTPGRLVAGGRYELYATCEPHNCGGNFLYTLFAPGGGRAWALLTRDGGDYRYFGSPDPAQRAILAAAATQ